MLQLFSWLAQTNVSLEVIADVLLLFSVIYLRRCVDDRANNDVRKDNKNKRAAFRCCVCFFNCSFVRGYLDTTVNSVKVAANRTPPPLGGFRSVVLSRSNAQGKILATVLGLFVWTYVVCRSRVRAINVLFVARPKETFLLFSNMENAERRSKHSTFVYVVFTKKYSWTTKAFVVFVASIYK